MVAKLAHQTTHGLFWQIASQRVQWQRQPNTMQGPSSSLIGSIFH
jgi:hypothetical protein